MQPKPAWHPVPSPSPVPVNNNACEVGSREVWYYCFTANFTWAEEFVIKRKIIRTDNRAVNIKAVCF
jgi:hypothetical protein